MTEIEFEKYLFLRLYSVDIDTARHTLKILKRYRKLDVKVILLRDLAVTYSKPFTTNRGDKIKKHTLPLRHVPINLRAIHQKLVDLRNQQFAHTDLSYHKPKLAKFGSGSEYFYLMSLKTFDYPSLLKEISLVGELIKSVYASIREEIGRYESQF